MSSGKSPCQLDPPFQKRFMRPSLRIMPAIGEGVRNRGFGWLLGRDAVHGLPSLESFPVGESHEICPAATTTSLPLVGCSRNQARQLSRTTSQGSGNRSCSETLRFTNLRISNPVSVPEGRDSQGEQVGVLHLGWFDGTRIVCERTEMVAW